MLNSRYSKDPEYWISQLDKHNHYANRMAMALGIPVASIQGILIRAGLHKQSRHGRYTTELPAPKPVKLRKISEADRHAEPHDIDWSEAPIAKRYGIPPQG